MGLSFRNPPVLSEGSNRVRVRWPGRSLAAIVRLLLGVLPSAVTRHVRPIVVDTAQRVVGWSRPHASKEVLKRVDPFRADGNSSATVTWVGWISRIKAPRFHAGPRLILGRVSHSVLQMRRVIPKLFVLQASARLRPCVETKDNICAAVAPGQPITWPLRSIVTVIEAHVCEPTDPLSSAILQLWPAHDPAYHVRVSVTQ